MNRLDKTDATNINGMGKMLGSLLVLTLFEIEADAVQEGSK